MVFACGLESGGALKLRVNEVDQRRGGVAVASLEAVQEKGYVAAGVGSGHTGGFGWPRMVCWRQPLQSLAGARSRVRVRIWACTSGLAKGAVSQCCRGLRHMIAAGGNARCLLSWRRGKLAIRSFRWRSPLPALPDRRVFVSATNRAWSID